MSKTDYLNICIMGYVLLVLVGCNPVGNPNTIQSGTASPAPTGPATAQPQQGDSTAMPPTSQTPTPSGLENLIEQAREDLAQRLSIPTTQIKLVEATEVEWTDSSLDCPQPGMSYLQVITPGYRILLEAGGTHYEYHSDRGTYVVYCENTNPPVLPKP